MFQTFVEILHVQHIHLLSQRNIIYRTSSCLQKKSLKYHITRQNDFIIKDWTQVTSTSTNVSFVLPLHSFFSALQLGVSFALLNNLPQFFSPSEADYVVSEQFTVWCQPHAQPSTWRTRVSLFVRLLPLTCPACDSTSSYATAGIALRVSGELKPHRHDKVETPLVGLPLHYIYNYHIHELGHVWSVPSSWRLCCWSPIITVGALCFVVFLRGMLEFSPEFGCLPFVQHDISSMAWQL
jgi:hypothetical protein